MVIRLGSADGCRTASTFRRQRRTQVEAQQELDETQNDLSGATPVATPTTRLAPNTPTTPTPWGLTLGAARVRPA